jgi:hypothetical protein
MTEDPMLSFLHPHALPATLARVDLQAVTRDLVCLFRQHGATTQRHPVNAQLHLGSFGRAVAIQVLEAPRLARVVIAHLRVPHILAGVVVVAHPRIELEAPILVADLMVSVRGRTRAYLDTVGPATREEEATAGFRARLGGALNTTGLLRLGTPAWAAPLSGGTGARLRAGIGRGSIVSEALIRYCGGYICALDGAEPAQHVPQNISRARAARETFRQFGHGQPLVASRFSAEIAAQFFSLLWNEGECKDEPARADHARQKEKPADPPAKFGVTTGVT